MAHYTGAVVAALAAAASFVPRPQENAMMTVAERNAYIIANLKRLNPGATNFSHDIGSPTRPVGHASGIVTATQVLRSYRKSHRPTSQYVEPDEVIECPTGRWLESNRTQLTFATSLVPTSNDSTAIGCINLPS